MIKKQDSLYFFLILIKMVPMFIPDVYGGYSGYTVRSVYFDSIAAALILSLGMLGSLSIVRFRTNIRDPRDIGFIFWAMAIGIAALTV